MPREANPIYQIDRLYTTGLRALSREIERLDLLTIGGKLSFTDSKDLRDYMKLLREMKAAQEAIMAEQAERRAARRAKVTDEELTQQVKEAITAPDGPIIPPPRFHNK